MTKTMLMMSVIWFLLCSSVIRSFSRPLQAKTKLAYAATSRLDEFGTDGFLQTISIDSTALALERHESKKARLNVASLAQKIAKLDLKANLLKLLKNIFLPVDYPFSVPAEYTRYQGWNLLQDLCSYLRSIMSTQAILEGFGVGRGDVTAVQATILWIIRDGASLLSGLVFTTLSSYNLGQNVKLWRLFADTINNVGITLDMLAPTPLFRPHFLFIICCASVCKALCGIAAGATNVAIAEHWGELNGNIADVSSRNHAQHTMVSLLGLAVSIKFAKMANRSPAMLWAVYGLLTGLHMTSNYQAMRILALRSLNVSRYSLLVRRCLMATTPGALSSGALTVWLENHRNQFTFASIAQAEPILSLLWLPASPWASPSKVASEFSGQDIACALQTYGRCAYFIVGLSPPVPSHPSHPSFISPPPIPSSTISSFFSIAHAPLRVCLEKGALSADHAKALFETQLLEDLLRPCNPVHSQTSPLPPSSLLAGSSSATDVERRRLVAEARAATDRLFPVFWAFLKQVGWKTELAQLVPGHVSKYRLCE